MKFHPHLHVITNATLNFNFNFNKLWRRTILNNLKLESNKYYYGYYVWSDNRLLNPKKIAKYIARYVRHPAIANGRIINYDKNKVTFFYKNNQNQEILIAKSVVEFITSLIQHIPPQQFKMIRYYGKYVRNKRTKYEAYNTCLLC